MVQLKDDSSDTSTNSHVKPHEYREPRPAWPYLLFALGVALIAVGVVHLQDSVARGKCPFHSSTESEKLPNPHTYDPTLYSEELVFGSKKRLADVYSGRVITKEELAKHGPGSTLMWLSVLGQVFDVTAGWRHYGSGGTYSFFTGKDGSRAYSTGHFTEEGLTDDISGLSSGQLGEIFNWINIFSKKYTFIGRLEGRFFTSEGLPTAAWRNLETALLDLGVLEEEKRALRRKYPSCNSHYDNAAGKAEVWCTVKSGGIPRDWEGYPRQLHLPGEKVRCACIHKDLLDDPKLKSYPDCAPEANSCRLLI